MSNIKQHVEEAFTRYAIDLLIEKKYIIQEQFDERFISYDEYCSLMEDVQNDIDCLCPIDISFI
jgi:hypothetical protein